MLAVACESCEYVYMYVAVVPNRSSPPAILLRESFRENGKVHNRTLANISHWPPEQIAALREVLKALPPLPLQPIRSRSCALFPMATWPPWSAPSASSGWTRSSTLHPAVRVIWP